MQRSTTNDAPLDWGDTDAVREWARSVLTQALDAVGAGEDATRPPGQRELGRCAARRIIADADDAMKVLAAAAGLDLPERPAEAAERRAAPPAPPKRRPAPAPPARRAASSRKRQR